MLVYQRVTFKGSLKGHVQDFMFVKGVRSYELEEGGPSFYISPKPFVGFLPGIGHGYQSHVLFWMYSIISLLYSPIKWLIDSDDMIRTY